MSKKYVYEKAGNVFRYADSSMKALHSDDGPAVEYADGTKMWYANGKLHRENGPAVEQADGTKIWFDRGRSVDQPGVFSV